MFKILVLKNEKLNNQSSFDKSVAYFKSKGIDVSFEFQSVGIPISVVYYKSVQGFDKLTGKPALIKYLGTSTSVKDACLALVKPNTYQAVILSYDMNTVPIPNNSVITSWCDRIPLMQGTEFIQIAGNQYFLDMDRLWKAITHEIMHSFCYALNRKGIPVLDEIDITVMPNGERVPAYKNDDPYATDSNYAQTLQNIGANFSKLYPAVVGYKYFSQAEVAKWKLKPELWELLDKARGIAGIPFKITSGFRTPQENASVGGVPNSAHLTGEASDIACSDSQSRFKMVSALLQVGFIRIETAIAHIHVDISKTLPQNVFITSDKD